MPEPVETAPEPSLFNEMDRETAHEQAEDLFDDDEVPAPAYRPEPEQTQEVAQQQAEPEAEDYVAPRHRTGAPSPETLARLKDAISRDNPHRAAGPAPRPAAEEGQGARKPFGINSLINRMTGHAEEAPVAQPRRQPNMSARPAPQEDDSVDPDQERIEIPAFLRRQAN